MKKKRKALSKRQRFEVFKRDFFTCQYCGNSAPDVILHVDHINPVSKGGNNKLTNLITSCVDCNSGKSNKKLDDSSAVKLQMQELKKSQERADQIKMIAKWAKEQLMKPEIDAINDTLTELNNTCLNEGGEKWIRSLIRKYGLKEILDSLYESWDKYGEDYVKKLELVIRYRNASEEDRYWMYSIGILRNRINYYDKHKSAQLIKEAKDKGLEKEEFRHLCYDVKNWTEYRQAMEDFIYGEEIH